MYQCAIREVKEETGLTVDPKELTNSFNIKGNINLFFVERPECDIKVQATLNNDANGIGWIKLECLESMVDSELILLNYCGKSALKRFLKLNIKYRHKNTNLNGGRRIDAHPSDHDSTAHGMCEKTNKTCGVWCVSKTI
jgi:hypothetical protein